MMSRNGPKVAHSVLIEPLMVHVLLMGHIQNALCKTDQPPCQLRRPQRLNNRIETDTYILVCIGFRMELIKYIILYISNVVANTLHSSVNEFSGLLLMECMCLICGPNRCTSQGGDLVHGSHLHSDNRSCCWQAQFSF